MNQWERELWQIFWDSTGIGSHLNRRRINLVNWQIICYLLVKKVIKNYIVLQLETALATLVITWFTLADRRWTSRYRSSDQCILNAFRSSEPYNGWFREQLGQVASAVSNCNTHKHSIVTRHERSIRSFAMSIAKHLMWFTSLTVTSAGRNT